MATPLGGIAKQETGSLYGNISALNPDTGEYEPVVGATVQLVSAEYEYVGTTDAYGDYMFVNIAPTTYMMNLSANGYNARNNISVTVLESSSSPACEANYYMTHYVDTTQYGVLTGQVIDENGDPVSGATVTINVPNVRSYTATTNAQGVYTFNNVVAATYRISVTKSGYNSVPRPGETVPTVTVRANTTTTNPTVGPTITLKPYQQAVFNDIVINVVTQREKKEDDGTNVTEPIANADVYIYDGFTGQWKRLGSTGDTGTVTVDVEFTLYGQSHAMQLRDASTGAVLAETTLQTLLTADGSDIIRNYTVTFVVKLVNPTISATLVTVRDEQLLAGAATEVFSKYAYNTSSDAAYDEAAMSAISSKFDASFDDELVNGGGRPVASGTDSADVNYVVYEYTSVTAMKAVYLHFRFRRKDFLRDNRGDQRSVLSRDKLQRQSASGRESVHLAARSERRRGQQTRTRRQGSRKDSRLYGRGSVARSKRQDRSPERRLQRRETKHHLESRFRRHHLVHAE